MEMLVGKQAQDMVAKVEPLFKGFPHLPKAIVDFLVMIVPWLAGIGGIFRLYGGITSAFFGSGRGSAFSAIFGVNPAYFVISGIIAILTGVLLLMAFKPLQAGMRTGWMYLFWTTLLSVLSSLVGLIMGVGGIFGLVFGLIIGYYLLFEIKGSFTK